MNNYTFATGSEDGSISLWATNKTKPVQTLPDAHGSTWISSLATHPNSDLLVSGASDGSIKFHKLGYKGPKKCLVEETLDLDCKGVVSCMQVGLQGRVLAVVVSPEDRLGRWTTCKSVKTKIVLFKLN